MRIKILVIVMINLLFCAGEIRPVFALEHIQKDALFSMDIPESWHWVDGAQEVIIVYPDVKTVAIDIQWAPSLQTSQVEIKKILKEGNDKMIKDGIEGHDGVLIDNKEIRMDGVYATQLDFKTASPNSIFVTYISFLNKGYAFTITYGTVDDNMRLMLDDAAATFKFNTKT